MIRQLSEITSSSPSSHTHILWALGCRTLLPCTREMTYVEQIQVWQKFAVCLDRRQLGRIATRRLCFLRIQQATSRGV